MFRILIALVLGLLSSCSSNQKSSEVANAAFVGGVSGAAIGAGTGALIGSAIANGDIAMSAALGGGIGLPAGIIIGILYAQSRQSSELDRNEEFIKDTYREINDRQEEIEKLREELRDDTFVVEPDPALKENLYIGPTTGNAYR